MAFYNCIYIISTISTAIETAGVALIGVIGTILTQWVKNKISIKKEKKNGFQAIIDANTAYREEIRRDLKLAKEEILICKSIIEKLEKKIKNLEKDLEDCQSRLLHEKDREVDD